jgi:glycerophosphoryl diester phosphodiesterase
MASPVTLDAALALSSASLMASSAVNTNNNLAFANLWKEPPRVIDPKMTLSLGIQTLSPSAFRSQDGWQLQSSSTSSLFEPVLVPPEKSLRHILQVKDNQQKTRRRPQVVGHRGALYDELENTRQAFRRCVDLQCDAVELDVFVLPRDGTLVVFHGGGTDANPGDLSDYCLKQAGRSILDLTFAETQTLQFNPEFAEFPCPPKAIAQARIPTLEQVLLDLKGTSTKLKIELKGPHTVEPVLEVVERLQMTEQCSYSSFDHDRLRQLRQLRPDQTTHVIGALFDTRTMPADNFIQLAQACGATSVHLQYDSCTTARVERIRDAGMTSMAWFRGPSGMADDTLHKYWDVGNEDEACYQAVVDTGVDELCVNKPDVLLRLLAKLEEEELL